MMDHGKLVQVSAFPGWIVGVSDIHPFGYLCWVMTPELIALNDGEVYGTSGEAMAAGRALVHYSLELEREEDSKWL